MIKSDSKYFYIITKNISNNDAENSALITEIITF